MEKNILIVDRSSRQRSKISKVVLRHAGQSGVSVKIKYAVNPVRAMRILETNDIDMMILNVVYKKNGQEELSGIFLVEELRKWEKYVLLPVIFIGNCPKMREYAFDELNCFGYQPYEFNEEALVKLIRKGLHYKTVRDENVEVYVKDKTVFYPIRVKDIIYIKKYMNGLCFQLQNGNAVTIMSRTIADVKRKLKNRYLLQCARDTVVNRDYIETLDKESLTLRSGKEAIRIPISRGYLRILRKELM